MESHTLDFNAIACIKVSLSGGERQLFVARADCYLAMLARQENSSMDVMVGPTL